MNRAWMRDRLAAFQELCVLYGNNRGDEGLTARKDITDQLTMQMPTVRRILQELNPALPQEITQPDYLVGMHSSLRATQEGLGILADWDEVAANLAPDSPVLIADGLHSNVWQAAAPIWETGQYRLAVAQAATSLSAHIAAKAGSHLAERELVAQVFSPNPPSNGMARLHLPGERETKTWRSRQDGLHLVAQGAFAGIRNLATHSVDDWTEHEALERLAVLSVVARWLDETKLVK